MAQAKTILVIGTYDTKDPELLFACDCIRRMGGNVISMDVSVLGDPTAPTDISRMRDISLYTQTVIDAWALVTKHAHNLLRSGPHSFSAFVKRFRTS